MTCTDGRNRHALHANEAERDAFVAAFAVGAGYFTPAEREAVHAVFFEGRPLRTAAAHVGVNFGTFRDRIRAARATLRLWLQRERTLA